jgi:hypothetical protein
LLFLTWTLLGLFIWFLQKLAGFTFVTAPIMTRAKHADEEVPFQLPIFQTIARSFILRDSSTMLRIKARQVDKDCTYLESEVEEIKLKLANRKEYLDQLEAKRQKAQAYEKKLIEKYKEKVREEGGTLIDDPVPGGEGQVESGSASSSAGPVLGTGAAGSSRNIVSRAATQGLDNASQAFGAGPIFSGTRSENEQRREEAAQAFSSAAASASNYMSGLQAQASAAYQDATASSAQAPVQQAPAQRLSTASARPGNPFSPTDAPSTEAASAPAESSSSAAAAPATAPETSAPATTDTETAAPGDKQGAGDDWAGDQESY